MLTHNIVIFYLWIFLETIAFVLSIVGNSVVIYVMRSEKWLKKKSSYFIVSLSMTDLLTSVFAAVIVVFRAIKIWVPSNSGDFTNICLWIGTILLSLSIVSVVHLMFVSVERYLAVCHPVAYHTRSTAFAKLLIFLCWMVGL